MEMVVWGYGLIEAPRVSKAGEIYFSDVFSGGVYCWSPDETVETIIPRRRGVGGLVLHQDGGLVVTGKTVVHHTPSEDRTLLQLDDVPGFNDLITDRAGRVYVGSLRSGALDVGERIPGDTWRIEPEGHKTLIYDNVSFANGIDSLLMSAFCTNRTMMQVSSWRTIWPTMGNGSIGASLPAYPGATLMAWQSMRPGRSGWHWEARAR